ncbi:MAG: hypothetical protein LBS19_07995 [Clostridiales bacterium]|nr:hypothetical protein [Clostridiales bacterium]
MLTNVFYYGHYKPYIIRSGSDIRGEARAQTRAAKRSVQSVIRDLSGNVSVTKNNSIKSDVVDYAGGIYRHVTEIKDASKFVMQNSEAYYSTIIEESHEVAKNWAAEDLSSFANAYNAVVGFTGRQEHSAELAQYGDDIKAIALEYRAELEDAGLSLADGGRTMNAAAWKLRDMDYLELGSALSGAARAAEAVYERTSYLLQRPLSEHMDFKQLSFYYNYGITASGKNSATSLLSGIILDRAI